MTAPPTRAGIGATPTQQRVFAETLAALGRAQQRAELAEAQLRALLVLLECTRGRMEGVEVALQVAMPAEIAPLYAAFRARLREGVSHIDRTVAGVHAALLDAPGDGPPWRGRAAAASPLAIAGGGIEPGEGVEGSRSERPLPGGRAASAPSTATRSAVRPQRPQRPQPRRIYDALESVVGGGA